MTNFTGAQIYLFPRKHITLKRTRYRTLVYTIKQASLRSTTFLYNSSYAMNI